MRLDRSKSNGIPLSAISPKSLIYAVCNINFSIANLSSIFLLNIFGANGQYELNKHRLYCDNKHCNNGIIYAVSSKQ